MRALLVLMLLPMLVYCVIQTYRDVRRRNWIFATWGAGMTLSFCWIIDALTSGSSY